MKTAMQVLESAFRAGLDIGSASDYAEPGYSLGSGKRGILFADWNENTRWVNGERTVINRTMSRLAKVAERAGFECEWSDEWATCDCCHKAVRTEPDSYSWRPSYVYGDGEILCRECAEDEVAACMT
jgi:hypothetical protein